MRLNNYINENNKILMKKILKAIYSWLPDDEAEAQKPNYSRQDDEMDARTTIFHLENEDYEAAYDSMSNYDIQIAKMIKKLK